MSLVTEFLTKRGVSFQVLHHLPVSTSLGEAVVLGVPADQVAKTIVLDTPHGHALAVIPASRRLDPRLVERAIGTHPVRLAPESEIEGDYPDYELGAFPPLAEPLGSVVYLDSELAVQPWVVFATGSRSESVRLRPADLVAIDSAAVAPLTLQPAETRETELVG